MRGIAVELTRERLLEVLRAAGWNFPAGVYIDGIFINDGNVIATVVQDDSSEAHAGEI